MECHTPATMLQNASRTAEAAEVSQIDEAVLATLRHFDAEKCSISCSNIYLSLYHTVYLNVRIMIFWLSRSRPCRRRSPFYTSVLPISTNVNLINNFVTSFTDTHNSSTLTPWEFWERARDVVVLQKNWKTSAVSTTDWIVETQLCKLRGTSDTFVGRAYSMYLIYNVEFVN